MSLVIGARVGSYEIVAPIGAGGMGEDVLLACLARPGVVRPTIGDVSISFFGGGAELVVEALDGIDLARCFSSSNQLRTT